MVGRRIDPDSHRLRDFLTRVAQPLRVVGAVGEGSMAVALAHRRLEELHRS